MSLVLAPDLKVRPTASEFKRILDTGIFEDQHAAAGSSAGSR